MLNSRLVTLSVTVFATWSYLLCVAFGLLTPQGIHMHQLLELLLPGFVWISLGAFFLGLVGSVLWGVYIGAGFALTYNVIHRLTVGRKVA